MSIDKTRFRAYPVQIHMGFHARGRSVDDGKARVLDHVVIGSNQYGETSQDSILGITGLVQDDGPSEVAFQDLDQKPGLVASVSRNDKGLGALTVINEGLDGHSSLVTYPLGAVEISGPLNDSWGSPIVKLEVHKGLGADSMILLNGHEKIFLDGSVEMIDLG